MPKPSLTKQFGFANAVPTLRTWEISMKDLESKSLALSTLFYTLIKVWGLTPREAEVLALMMQGHSSSNEISDALDIAFATTQRHLESICAKSGCKGRKEVNSYLLRIYERMMLSMEMDFIRNGKSRKVYVVDDDRDISDILVSYLDNAGFEAVPHFQQPELLDDKALSGGNILVYDLTYQYRDYQNMFFPVDRRIETPLISRVAMTGFPDFLAENADRISYESLLKKPFSQKEVVDSVIRAILSRHSLDIVRDAS